jgi:hypothetical protein bbifN4_00972
MVVSVIPVQQVQPVKAAAGDMIPAGTTIYLRPNAATTWISDGAVMAFKTSANNKQSGIVVMTEMDDGLTWYGKTIAEATNIDFLRLNPKNKDVWNEAGTWPGLESGKNLYTFALHTGVTPTGMWTTYSNTGSETTSYFNVNATLVDYFNNGRVEQPKNTLYNEGNMTGEKNAPYAKLNQWLSNLPGYALNGVDSTDNVNAPVPLYFGDLLHTSQAGGNGNLSWYWKGANVAFGPNKETASKDVAQGIVGKNLDDGNLITSYTNENGDPVKVPFFNEDAYPNQSKYMRFYNNLQFPFTKTTNDKGVSTYSFDSAKNTVYYDYDNKKIVRKDDLKIHDASKDNSIGYFPFNSTDPDQSAKDNLNYGFGTQFTIPFTVTETGKNVDGSEMEFNFTGDDDVWVYIDGALVLDMGGAHNKAEGKINFAKQEATIRTGTSNAKLGNSLTVGGRTPAEPNGNTTVKFENIMVKKSGSEPVTLDKYMKKSGTVHELKMYYMERGMWNSNMSISYSFVPLPSGLTLSKTLDTTDVNAGLKNAVQGLDNFDFKIQKKNLKTDEANYSDVENLGYTLYDYDDRTFPGQEAKDSTATFSSSYFASDFINTKDKNNSSAFYAGTGFQITESIPQGTKLQYDTSKTRWGVYDSITSRAAIEGGKGAVATFNMGDDTSSEMDVVNRYVNFVNTPKVGSLSVAKKYEGYAPENETFGFTVLVDLTGHDYYDSYKLEYNGTQNGTTDENGHFTLKVGDTVTFAGIPAGATYKVVEDSPQAGDTWVQETTSDVTGKIEANVTSAAVVTNKTKTTVKDYVIYAEAGKTVTYAPDGVAITELTAQTTGDTVINTNVKGGKGEFTPESPNEKYVVNYTGTTTNNGNFTGTITVYTYKATDKVYVFDYGLESNIADATTGDGLFQDGTFYNDKAKDTVDDTTAKLDQITSEASDIDDRQTEITGNQNAINRDGSAEGEVTFKPIAFMDKVEKYTYTANITKVDTEFNSANPETGTTVHGTIKTMPANVVYYEDNFNKDGKDDSAVKIIYSGTTTTDRSTDGTDVKLEQSNDQSEQYGHDNAYANGDKYSNGSSTKMEKSAKATFTFKGTGFDIISRTNTKTGTIGVKVYKGEKASGEPIRNIPLITYYDDGDLYQVPVIHETDFDYGTYTVVVEVKSYNPDGIVFYLDGVRIYEPLDDQEYTDEEGTTYDSDNYLESEVDAHIYEIRPMIIGNTVDGKTANHAMLMQYTPGGNVVLSAGGNTVVETLNGIVPEGATETTDDFERYWKWGPNNELYLEPGNAVGFLIPADIYDSTKPYATFQIGAKATSNKAVTLKTILPDGTEAKDSTITVNSATDMYYKINVTDEMKTKDGKYYQVVIANTDGGMVSLTNIKSTCDPIDFGVPAADTTAMRMMAASMISAFSTKDEVVSEAAFATVVRSGRDATLAVTSTVGVEKLKITDSNGQVMDNSTLNISYTDKVLNGNKLRTWRVKFKPNLKRGKYKYTVEGITAENKATVRIGTPTLTVR